MEAEWLDKHLMKCEKCSEDFVAYEAIMGALSFEDEADTSIANDLEMRIMGQIGELSIPGENVDIGKQISRTHMILCMSFIVMMILLPVVLMKWDIIMEMQAALHNAYAASIGSFTNMLDVVFERLRYIIMLATMLLIFIQLVLWEKGRAV